MGLNISYASSLVSAYPIIGIDVHRNKLKISKNFGVTHGILFKKDFHKKISKILNGKLPDVVFETTGKHKLMEKAYEITPNNGKTVYVGVPDKKISIYSLPLAFDKSLAVSHGGDSKPDEDIPRYVRLIENKKIRLNKLITHEFSLKDINKALKLFRSGKAGRILINLQR